MRSRGISGTSGISGDLNLANNAHTTSHSSNEMDSSLLCQQRFADKVRRVTFQGSTTPQTPQEDQSIEDIKEGEELEDNEDVDKNGGGHLSPYHQKVANRRSHSYSREPRSPSWNEANFNSSALSCSNSHKSSKNSCSDVERLVPGQLNLSQLSPSTP